MCAKKYIQYKLYRYTYILADFQESLVYTYKHRAYIHTNTERIYIQTQSVYTYKHRAYIHTNTERIYIQTQSFATWWDGRITHRYLHTLQKQTPFLMLSRVCTCYRGTAVCAYKTNSDINSDIRIYIHTYRRSQFLMLSRVCSVFKHSDISPTYMHTNKENQFLMSSEVCSVFKQSSNSDIHACIHTEDLNFSCYQESEACSDTQI